ncbi:NUDIX hydrolase [uncultured Draconibacterium sp.]|uniref:NUDIX hydrolase n=1 Tax=uncultured Draconibacterium sp. TaxID=1573823 RepID=UPI0025DBBEA4|nr:NUDIX hydrolase [uncultured Draconibacterium sp.]
MATNQKFNFKNYVKNTSLTVGVNPVIFSVSEDKLKVLIATFDPRIKKSLPGGAILKNENADDAANRVLKESTGLGDIFLKQFRVFSEPDRFSYSTVYNELREETYKPPEDIDIPDRVFTIGYFALVNFDTVQPTGGIINIMSEWVDIDAIPELMFDHNLIVTEALNALRKELFFEPIGYNLLPEKFTMPELQRIYEIILDKPLTRSNFQRKMLNWGIYERLEERKEGVSHKRPFLYRFNKDKYEEALKRGANFCF